LSPLGAMLGIAFGSRSPVLVGAKGEKKHVVSGKGPSPRLLYNRFIYASEAETPATR